VSTNDASVIACVKGLVAHLMGNRFPDGLRMISAMVTGFAGYGVSLVLFVIALRNLGTARTGAYFSVAPLFGVALSLVLWPEMPSHSSTAINARRGRGRLHPRPGCPSKTLVELTTAL
jgi:drug/metabolite transporter (DMT)-like permease